VRGGYRIAGAVGLLDICAALLEYQAELFSTLAWFSCTHAPTLPHGTPHMTTKTKPQAWVQTERKTHEAWAALTLRKPRAAALAHHLVAMCDPSDNAVVVSQSVLASLLGCSLDTIQRAVRDLVAGGWIEVVRIGKGKEAAYVLNDRVAWSKSRKDLVLSRFRATVVADRADQDQELLGNEQLRRFPALFPGEQQLPSGPGEDPPSQPSIPGLEPELPSLQAQLEKRGQRRLVD
jgi:hypothetical protein